jgi:hypothetical protein
MPAPTNLPTADDVRRFLGNSVSGGPIDMDLIDSALSAATSRVIERCMVFTADLPETVVQAIIMQSARLYRRRFSMSGYEGFGEVGIARITALDPDIEDMLIRYLRYDFA